MKGSVKAAKLSFADRLLRYFCYCMVQIVQRPKLMRPRPKLDQPTIFVCRHVGLMDPVILMVVYFRRMIRALVAKDYYDKNKFTQSFYKHAQCIPLDRRNVSKQWIEDSLVALGKGESVIIFPEGRRNKSGKGLQPFHNGAALLAARSGARVVPVYNAFWHFPHRYRLAIGDPVQLDPLPAEGASAEWLKTQTARMQEAVAALAFESDK
ncbi:MAG: 1-acyl-sn-glycerol-3-phosphate acyltransferase [Bacteroidales bacterium]|nr:1-acyl-sn-glycerol-3-phosphate acyltransferase [Bacteroidales bacterium]